MNNECIKFDQCINHENCGQCIDQDLFIGKGDKEENETR